MTGISSKSDLNEWYNFLGRNMDSIIIEKIRDIQYIPRHQAKDPNTFIEQCFENLNVLKVFKTLGSPIINDYLDKAHYEKNYIQIFDFFDKNHIYDYKDKKLLSKGKLFPDLFDVVGFKNCFFEEIFTFEGAQPTHKVEVFDEQQLLHLICQKKESFFAGLNDENERYRDAILFKFSGQLELRMVCPGNLVLKGIDFTMEQRKGCWEVVNTMSFKEKAKKRDYGILIYYPKIQKQVLDYLL